MCKEISLFDLFAGNQIDDCYMLDGGYCYPVADIFGVKFSQYSLTNIAHAGRLYLAVEITCDDQVSYLIYIGPTQEGLLPERVCKPLINCL